ncbi:glycosyltransferase [Nonlabens sp. SCSIO 43208]|uniref:glycosyltransferase n=1 Tax=Nonlabens sp. SCSIO 43208 TaxID=2793009 RepID=UPI003D6A10D9
MINKKNILIVLPNDSLGGAEQYLKLIANHFGKINNYNIFVIFFKKKKTHAWEDNDYKKNYGTTDKERYGVFNVVQNIYKLRRKKFHYVFTSHVHSNALVGFLRKIKILNTRFIIGRESTSIFLRYKGLKLLIFKLYYRIGYSGIDLLICQSDLMKNQLVDNMIYIENNVNIRVIGNPVNLTMIKSFESKEITNNLIPKSFIVSAGRLIPEKGFDILIDAFKLIYKEHSDTKLVILGEGDLRIELEKKINSEGLSENIFLFGFVNNVYPFFRNAKLCVVSSRLEGFPNVLLQMMSQNNNVVSTLCAGGIDKIDGLYTCMPEDVLALANQMIKCLKTNNKENRRLFDSELKERSVEAFIGKIKLYLNETEVS